MSTAVALVATHPIQYHIPWYRGLAESRSVDLTVLFAAMPDAEAQGVGFDRAFSWDVPLLDGYAWRRLDNRRPRPRLDRFFASSAPATALLRQLRPAAVIVTGWHQWPLLQTIAACRRLGIPMIVRGESNHLRPRPRAVRLIHRMLTRQFDACLAIGSANREFYRRAGVAPERIVDCPYFVDNDRFGAEADRLTGARAQLRRAWGVSESATVFAFVGKLQGKKRPGDLVAAAAAAHRRGAALHLLIVGSGPLEAELRREATSAGVPATFAGFLNQSEVAKAYVASDALVLPSDAGETWGLVVNEAMACGRPAIVSDRVGCASDLVHDERTGHRFPCGDRDALARLLERFASRPTELAAMGFRAREHVNERCSVARAVDATERAVAMVAGR